VAGVKAISRLLAVTFLSLLAADVLHAHGLHAEVEPQFHPLVHVLQLAGVIALAVGIGFWARRRARRRRF
jgi:hypothetical protein